MSVSRITSRLSTIVLTRSCNSPLFSGRHESRFVSSVNHFFSPGGIHDKVIDQRFGFSSSASPPSNAQSVNEQETRTNNESFSAVKKRRRGAKRIAFSDSDSDDSDLKSDLSRDGLVKLVAKKERLLFAKQEEIENMKDKVLRAFAEMENVKERTRRESENAKKFAIQNFAKCLLDVADNLSRASYAAKESFTKIDVSKDTGGSVQQLQTLLEGVEMTEKQLSEVFRKFGLEKYDPTNEEFDPNRHNAVFQVPDASKPANHVAVVLKAGYMLHDRVIRPAEVGVTVATS
ncbi:hypothetical protein ABFX02_13G162900 [Erythranthe guttata]